MMVSANSKPDPAGQVTIRSIGLDRPWRWLTLGWRDLRRAGWPSLLHGILIALAALGVELLTVRYWYLLPGALTGLLLVGPILATGLYALSQALDSGRPARLEEAVAAWRRGTRPLVKLGLILVAASAAWVAVSSVLFAVFVETPFYGPLHFLLYVAIQPDYLFALWTILGGLVAAVVFASTVVSAPLLVDREINLAPALVVSLRAVGNNPVALALWAALIMAATALSLATLMLGFILVIPLFGHATWHAYRDLVDPDGLPARV